MGKTYAVIDHEMSEFIRSQPLFFVASAPLSATGHINLSPKGLDTFRILAPTKVAYLDLTGSGAETIAHVKENRRIVLMFCSFQKAPRIVRLHGLGNVFEPPQPPFPELQQHFPVYEGTRAIITVELDRISQSCGFGVPLLKLEKEREQLQAWALAKGAAGIGAYRREKNRTSIDGLPGVTL